MTGSILHVNAVGLMAAVETAKDRGLRSRPFVVARPEAPRAFVLDLSPAAHREGLDRGMLLSAALRRMPGLKVVEPHPDLYRLADETLWRLGLSYTPMVERAGRGHLFVDLAGTFRLHGSPTDAAQRLRLRIMEELGIAPSMALASNKTVSKVATRVFRPGGFASLLLGEEDGVVRMQPVELLPGVGSALRDRLRLLEIEDIGALADLSPFEARALGPRGPDLVARAGGMDDSPVDPEPPGRRVLEASTCFEPDSADPEILRLGVFQVTSSLGFAARKANMGSRRVGVGVEYTDGAKGFAAKLSPRLLTRDVDLAAAAWAAARLALSRRVRVRRLFVRLSGLGPAGPELDLFEPAESSRHGAARSRAALEAALDAVHGKYGFASLKTCAFLSAGAGIGATVEGAV
jgi:DNA polymerase IV